MSNIEFNVIKNNVIIKCIYGILIAIAVGLIILFAWPRVRSLELKISKLA